MVVEQGRLLPRALSPPRRRSSPPWLCTCGRLDCETETEARTANRFRARPESLSTAAALWASTPAEQQEKETEQTWNNRNAQDLRSKEAQAQTRFLLEAGPYRGGAWRRTPRPGPSAKALRSPAVRWWRGVGAATSLTGSRVARQRAELRPGHAPAARSTPRLRRLHLRPVLAVHAAAPEPETRLRGGARRQVSGGRGGIGVRVRGLGLRVQSGRRAPGPPARSPLAAGLARRCSPRSIAPAFCEVHGTSLGGGASSGMYRDLIVRTVISRCGHLCPSREGGNRRTHPHENQEGCSSLSSDGFRGCSGGRGEVAFAPRPLDRSRREQSARLRSG